MIFYIHFYLSLIHVLYFMSILICHLLHCTWLRCIRSYTKDPSHVFLASRWFVHNWFIELGNLFKVVVHHFLIRLLVGLGHRDGDPMVNALIFMVRHRIGSMVNHDIRLSSSHDFIKLIYFIVSQLWENIEFVQKLTMTLTNGWNRNMIIYSLWIRSLLMKVDNNRYY